MPTEVKSWISRWILGTSPVFAAVSMFPKLTVIIYHYFCFSRQGFCFFVCVALVAPGTYSVAQAGSD